MDVTDIHREAFLATGCKRVAEPTPDGNEFLAPVLKSIPDFFAQLVRGDCTDPEVGWMGLHALGYVKLDMRAAPAPGR